jgi:hypothetical protein
MKSALVSVLLLLGTIPVGHGQSVGVASYHRFRHFSGLVAEHRTLPIGTHVRVINLNNGRTATVVIVDRGPSISNSFHNHDRWFQGIAYPQRRKGSPMIRRNSNPMSGGPAGIASRSYSFRYRCRSATADGDAQAAGFDTK